MSITMHAQVKNGLVWCYSLYYPDSNWGSQYYCQESSYSLGF